MDLKEIQIYAVYFAIFNPLLHFLEILPMLKVVYQWSTRIKNMLNLSYDIIIFHSENICFHTSWCLITDLCIFKINMFNSYTNSNKSINIVKQCTAQINILIWKCTKKCGCTGLRKTLLFKYKLNVVIIRELERYIMYWANSQQPALVNSQASCLWVAAQKVHTWTAVVQWTETRAQMGNASVFWYNTAHGLAECTISK